MAGSESFGLSCLVLFVFDARHSTLPAATPGLTSSTLRLHWVLISRYGIGLMSCVAVLSLPSTLRYLSAHFLVHFSSHARCTRQRQNRTMLSFHGDAEDKSNCERTILVCNVFKKISCL